MKSNCSRFLLVLLLSATIFPTWAQSEKKTISLEDIFKNRKFSSKGVSGIRSMKDGIHFTQVKNDSVNVYEYETGKYVKTILTSKQLIPKGDTVPLLSLIHI